MMTAGFTALSPAMQGELIKRIRLFNAFAKGNDPQWRTRLWIGRNEWCQSLLED
jgi:hypothetical protein